MEGLRKKNASVEGNTTALENVNLRVWYDILNCVCCSFAACEEKQLIMLLDRGMY